MISELGTFVAVARYGTFAAAGDRIGLTQGAVSGHIHRLEEHLGFALFDRTGRSARLTPEGQRTLARAEPLLRSFEALGEAQATAELDPPIRIGAIHSTQPSLLGAALVAFRKRFPRARVHIKPGVSVQLLDDLDAGELDFAILVRPSFGIPSGFLWQPLYRETYALLVPATVRGSSWSRILTCHPFLRYERSSLGGRQVDRFLRTRAIQVTDAIELDDLQALVAMVARGLGVTIVPMARYLEPLPRGVRRIPIDEDGFVREVGLVRSERPGTPVMEQLAASITRAARQTGANALSAKVGRM